MVKGILMVIFLGFVIFIWKNLDRWKEILMIVFVIVIGVVIFFKVLVLVNWFMSIF